MAEQNDKIYLTEQEKREIARLVTENKPLPDKYRFLLFQQNKNQVELVWDGKTTEITSVALPFQTIETVDEPREEEPEKGNQQQSFLIWMNGVVKSQAGLIS